MITAEILGIKDLIAILFIGSVVLVLVLMGRRINLNIHGVKATVERAEAKTDVATQHAEIAVQKAEQVAENVLGVANGNGDLVTMVTRILAHQAEILRWQEVHGLEDMAQMQKLIAELQELQKGDIKQDKYLHKRVHDLAGLIVGSRGWTDIMWREIGLEEKYGPIPKVALQPYEDEEDPETIGES